MSRGATGLYEISTLSNEIDNALSNAQMGQEINKLQTEEHMTQKDIEAKTELEKIEKETTGSINKLTKMFTPLKELAGLIHPSLKAVMAGLESHEIRGHYKDAMSKLPEWMDKSYLAPLLEASKERYASLKKATDPGKELISELIKGEMKKDETYKVKSGTGRFKTEMKWGDMDIKQKLSTYNPFRKEVWHEYKSLDDTPFALQPEELIKSLQQTTSLFGGNYKQEDMDNLFALYNLTQGKDEG